MFRPFFKAFEVSLYKYQNGRAVLKLDMGGKLNRIVHIIFQMIVWKDIKLQCVGIV